ncbi:MAG: hypothetical protein H6943_09090 [Zoogloeaceae bacterium]|nr:hypothetical protein [Zoogloeaceae bacterium]
MWINSTDLPLQVFFEHCAQVPYKFDFFVIYSAPTAPIMMEGIKMADNENDNDIPFMQKLLDNHFLLLFLGVVSPGVLYILWGIIDIMNTPLAK